MEQKDRAEFSIMFVAMATAFDKEATDDVMETYWGALKDLPLADVKFAAETALKTLEWWPKPAQLRKLAGDVGPDHRAAIAWRAVRKALNEHGTYCSVNFDDPVVNATIRNLGGWVALGQKEAKDFDIWVRKEFERIYLAIYSTGVTEESGAYLTGITEHENRGRYEIQAPTTVPTGLPVPNIRMLSTGKVSKELAGEIVAKAFALAEDR
jgi:hypothetical protein